MTSPHDDKPLQWFDAHLDLAYMAIAGRDMLAPPQHAGGPDLPGCVTLQSLQEGRVKWTLGTIFTQTHAPDDAWGYGDSSDVAGAQQAAIAQLKQYEQWETQGHIRIIRSRDELDDQPADDAPLQVILLMENADPIGSPGSSHDAAWWFAQGVRVVGMAWTHGSRYAGGNGQSSQTHTLTDAGIDLVHQLDELGIIHDLTHLNDASAMKLLQLSRGHVIATHSASRTLQKNAVIPVKDVDTAVVVQRHISDELLMKLRERGSLVGLPLYWRFLESTRDHRPDIARVVEHLACLADKLGGWQHVGIGSDFDGGFTASDTPAKMEGPTQLQNLATAMREQGHGDEVVAGIACENWLRFFGENLGG